MNTQSFSPATQVWIKSLSSPQVAAEFAYDVDKNARFPQESLNAFKAEKLLSAPIATELGGMGLGLRAQCELVAAIAAHCGSSAMVLAMHYSQVACLARHDPESAFFADYQRELCDQQWLLGSVTSEVGTYGDTRSSICAVEVNGNEFTLDKAATTGSYSAYADALLVTCRRSPNAQASDQALVLVKKHQATLVATSTWDTMGMRGTCSPGVSVTSKGPSEQIFKTPFSDISSLSMLPVSHTLWAALWWGLAHSAYDKVAQLVRSQARKNPGVIPPAATRLAELMEKVEVARHHWSGVADAFDTLVDTGRDGVALHEMGWALRFNNLKTSASKMAPEIIHEALLALGIPGFSNQGPLSVSRTLRDALSGALMVSNERIVATNASMLLVYKDS